MMHTNIQKFNLDGEALVKEYAATGNPALKEKIVTAFSPVIKHVVGRFNMTYSTTMCRNDLYQFGIFGLLKALDRFKLDVGVPFKAYAYKRIYGEVVDSLRKEGLIGRDKYEKIKKLEETIKSLTSSFGRDPSADEVCEKMDISHNEYYSTLSASQLTYTLSLNTKIMGDEGEFIYRIDTLVDDDQMTPEEAVMKNDLKKSLKEVVNKLPEREKIIMALYFYEELTLADIGKVVGLSEARISQILNKTLVKIKAQLV